MTDDTRQLSGLDQPATYQIEVQGALDASWVEWFDSMTILVERRGNGSFITTLSGSVADQAALRGILSRLWDLNLALLSVFQIGGRPEPAPLDERRL